jgi:hypothetical protein
MDDEKDLPPVTRNPRAFMWGGQTDAHAWIYWSGRESLILEMEEFLRLEEEGDDEE